MNKDKLIDKIVDRTKYQKKQIINCLETGLDIVIETLKKGERVDLVGFGSFKVVKRKGRKGVNPRTLKEMKIRDVRVVKFRTGKRLKEAVK